MTSLARCPACAANLRPRKVGDVMIDGCDRCGGVWLDRGELAQLVERSLTGRPQKLAITSVPTRPRPRTCPRCAGLLAPKPMGAMRDVVVDLCVQHGVFLDHGELERIGEQLSSPEKPEPPRPVPPGEAAAGNYRRPSMEEALSAQEKRERLGPADTTGWGLLFRPSRRRRHYDAVDLFGDLFD